MLCARVMRGINSIERKLTPFSAEIAIGIERRQRLAEPDHRLPAAHQRQIAAAGLGIRAQAAHLQNHVRRAEHLGARSQAHALFRILGVGNAGAQTRARFQNVPGVGFV